MLDIIRDLKYNNQVANMNAAMAQEVERILGKDEVTSSTLVSSSIMNDIPNLNHCGSIEMSFILFKSSKERLSWPFLIFYLIELK